MVTNLKGERVPYVGYKLTVVDNALLSLYDSLTRGEQRRLKRESKKYDETKYSYLEEILIDYEKAYDIAHGIYYNLDANKRLEKISYQDLIMIILFCGFGVSKRSLDEISVVSGCSVQMLEEDKARLLETYKNDLVEIYDKVWQFLNVKENDISLVK